jgi:hypothetical protein
MTSQQLADFLNERVPKDHTLAAALRGQVQQSNSYGGGIVWTSGFPAITTLINPGMDAINAVQKACGQPELTWSYTTNLNPTNFQVKV